MEWVRELVLPSAKVRSSTGQSYHIQRKAVIGPLHHTSRSGSIRSACRDRLGTSSISDAAKEYSDGRCCRWDGHSHLAYVNVVAWTAILASTTPHHDGDGLQQARAEIRNSKDPPRDIAKQRWDRLRIHITHLRQRRCFVDDANIFRGVCDKIHRNFKTANMVVKDGSE